LNQKKVELFQEKLLLKRKFKVVKSMKKVQEFERTWIENVRYELYWGDMMRNVVDLLKENVKYEKV